MEKPEVRIGFREFKAISRAITTYQDLDILLKHLAEHICRSFGVKGCSILLFDDREKQLFRVSSYGVSKEYLDKGPLPLDVKSSPLFTGQPIFIDNMQTDRRVLYPEDAAKEGLVSMLSVPVKYGDSLSGILRIYHDSLWDLHEEDLDSFCLLGDHLGLVVENRGLKNFLDQVKRALGNLPLRMLDGL